MPPKITDSPDQNTQEDGTEDGKKKRDPWHFSSEIPEGMKAKPQSNLLPVLHRKENGKHKDHRPKQYLYPFHFSSSPMPSLFPQSLVESSTKLPIGIDEVFRNDLCLTQYWHEIRVSGPTRDDMKMDMFLSGPSHFSNIDANVESMGMKDCFQYLR